jgi:hypothetical protein
MFVEFNLNVVIPVWPRIWLIQYFACSTSVPSTKGEALTILVIFGLLEYSATLIVAGKFYYHHKN